MTDRLNVQGTLALLDEVREIVQGLDKTRPNIEVSSKDVMREKAEVQRKLLYAAHMADCARIDIMSHYHRFKGQNPPRIA